MGSVTAIFLLPFLSVFAIFIGFFETFIGIGTEKVALPYDPQNGIVWEYKEGDEAFIDCIKTEIKTVSKFSLSEVNLYWTKKDRHTTNIRM